MVRNMKLKDFLAESKTIKISNNIDLIVETGIITIKQGDTQIALTKISANKLLEILQKIL